VTGNTSQLSANNLSLGGFSSGWVGGTGTLTVDDGGTVEVADNTKFWSSFSSIAIDGGTLETDKLSNHTAVAATVSISDPAGSAALTVGVNDGDSTFDGLIQDAAGGPGSLTKTGGGTFTLTSANTYSGGTTISGGTLALGNSSAAGTGAITVLGSAIDYSDGVDVANAIDLQHDVTLNVSSGVATQTGEIGETGGSYGVTKTGAGTLTLRGANTFSGTANIDAGVLRLGSDNALVHNTVSINVNNGLDLHGGIRTIGALAGAGDLELNSGWLTVGGNDQTTIYSGVITGSTSSRFIHGGAGTLTLTGGDSATPSNFGGLQGSSGTVIVDGARIDLTGAASMLASGGDIIVRNAADLRLASSGNGKTHGAVLTVSGSGTSLTGSAFWVAESAGSTGSIVVEESASLDLAGDLAVAVSGEGDLNVRTGATASADRVGLGIGPPALGQALVTGDNSQLSTGFLYLGGAASNLLGGMGSLTVDDDGAVLVADDTKFWTSASSVTIDGGTLETDKLSNHTAVAATVSISDPADSAALTVGVNDGSSTFDGLIADAAGGPGSLTKTGGGTFTLTGTNTYSGGTLIDEGTLLANNTSGSATGTGSVQVNGATLGGTGSITGSVSVFGGGTVAPGASVGQLTVGSIAFEDGTQFVVELAGSGGVAGVDFDQLVVTNDATPDGTLQVSLIDDFVPQAGDTFDILDWGTIAATTFDAIELPDLAGRIAWNTSGLYTDGVIEVIGMLDGDTDVDWDVDTDDYNNFVAVFGGAGDWHTDFNEDGRVDLTDFVLMRANFGMVVDLGPAPIAAPAVTPEPATLTLLAIGGILVTRRRRRRS